MVRASTSSVVRLIADLRASLGAGLVIYTLIINLYDLKKNISIKVMQREASFMESSNSIVAGFMRVYGNEIKQEEVKIRISVEVVGGTVSWLPPGGLASLIRGCINADEEEVTLSSGEPIEYSICVPTESELELVKREPDEPSTLEECDAADREETDMLAQYDEAKCHHVGLVEKYRKARTEVVRNRIKCEIDDIESELGEMKVQCDGIVKRRSEQGSFVSKWQAEHSQLEPRAPPPTPHSRSRGLFEPGLPGAPHVAPPNLNPPFVAPRLDVVYPRS